MTLLHVDPRSPDPEVLARAARILRSGGLVAFPTETVYGLGADALDPEAVARIFAAKNRPAVNPLIVHVPDAAAARPLSAAWSELAERLAERFWPGPLTLVLPRSQVVPDIVAAGLPSVAIRVPAHPVALALLRAASIPVAAPSANRFTALSPTTAAHVLAGLGDAVDLILDGGPTDIGIESTVLDLTGERPVLLRPGTITREAIADQLGVQVLESTASPAEGTPRPSPGMHELHYSPRARLLRFASASRTAAERAAAAAVDMGGRVGALLLESRDRFAAPLQHRVEMPHDAAGYARRLYGELHALDEAGCTLIVVEEPPDSPAWAGVRDRLRRAGASAD